MRLRFALALALLSLALGACTTIDTERRVRGWPELHVVEHRVSFGELYKRCQVYAGPLMLPLACAEFYLDGGECHIWLLRDSSESVREHELAHCRGYDHPGEENLAHILTRWQAARRVSR